MSEDNPIDYPLNELTAQHKDKFDLCVEVHEHFEEIKSNVAKSNAFHSDMSVYRRFIGASACQIQMTFISILKLAAEGHINDCFALLRISVELILKMEYMASDPETLSAQFRNYSLIEKIRNYQRYMELNRDSGYDFKIDLDLRDKEKIIDEFTSNKEQRKSSVLPLCRTYRFDWTKRSLTTWMKKQHGKELAKNLAIRDEKTRNLLIAAYEHGCDFVHPKATTLDKYLKRDSHDDLIGFWPNYSPDQSDIQLLLCSLIHLLLSSCRILAAVFEIKLPDQHGRLEAKATTVFASGD